ncbi:MAG: choice-of-anchor E domain-containing protein [Kiritimatiellales bacterium]
MKKTALRIAALLLAAGSLQADTIVQTHEIVTHGPGNSDNKSVDTWSFDEFNTLGGALTLNSVQIIFSTQAWDGYIGTDNDGANGASGTVSFNLYNALTSGKTLVNSSGSEAWANQYIRRATTFNLAADDLDGAGYQEGGTDWDSFSGPTEGNADTASANIFIHDALKSFYQGTGTFNMSATSYQQLNAIIGGYSEVQASSQLAKGSVTIIYDYIPEPATASMSILVLIAGFWIRRRFID